MTTEHSQLDELVNRLDNRLRHCWSAAYSGLRGTELLNALNNVNVSLSPGQAAAVIISGLLDLHETQDPYFWATDLGRLVASVPLEDWYFQRPCVAAALGVSRQRVAELIGAGRLEMVAGGAITSESLAAFLKQRAGRS